ncbi:nickel pincer cofactor biosynthesis protein LarC [Treponema sp.]|uniref:nickel pincer cofactor biosynthesis protein LarC n=1 Tax=Treponema sp. TaxID=166 RepID=UPI0025FDF578|nr:nickel pincer cofactor biosynthesis protein LarC [Treponema sp.]MCR5218630.1 nickel pincer cofactor biosynthesis protein LarC [Treponema sp.]
MKELYFECQSGISGDMAVAALLDAGASSEKLKEALASVKLEGYSIEISKVFKNGIECTDFNVILNSEDSGRDHDMKWLFGHLHQEEEVYEHEHEHEHGHEHGHGHEHEHGHHHHHTSLAQIYDIIDSSGISQKAKELSKKIFAIISRAEAKAHGTSPEEVHLHETGGIDSIIDIISFAVCMEDLGIDQVCIKKICEGQGSIRCSHGILPVPVPATLYIAEENKLPLSITNVEGELVTPTGAAIAAAVRTSSRLPEEFTVLKSGWGAGKRSYSIPSVLRVMIIESQEEEDSLFKLETDIDDSTPETMGFLMEELYKNHAREAHYTPCFMKKNRPGFTLTVICKEEDKELLEKTVFLHSSSIGIRSHKIKRSILKRECIMADSPYGQIQCKKIYTPGGIRFVPEYEDVAKTARESGKSFYDLYREIQEYVSRSNKE